MRTFKKISNRNYFSIAITKINILTIFEDQERRRRNEQKKETH